MKKIFLLAILGLSLFSCKKDTTTENTNNSENEVATETLEQKSSNENDSKTLDLTKIPISTFPITQIPFFSLPTGYKYSHEEKRNYESIRFWTGSSFEMPEGELFCGRISNDKDHSYSGLELFKNLDQIFKEAGAVALFEGKVPQEAITQNEEKYPISDYGIKSNAYGFQGFAKTWTYIIRQDNQNIWLQLNESDDNASLHVAIIKTKAVAITSQLIKADEMKLSLEQNGLVTLYINFETNKSDIQPEAKPTLEEVFKLLKENPSLKLSIEGHTDNSGDKKYNFELSEARAKSIVAYLTQKGISSERLQSKGYGDTKPLQENTSEDNKALNRRVELRKIG
ncbi:OmpA family protein [Flavobacterium sp. NRK F7]|uniref:OmpA family protein n=1 Tax=Flavobacterium sp. NRK F7 TaxID=2954930 RepID=UPI00209169BC|nr:OmpA family protein [Flavobacterium sp. NRK F7]MCO6161361.1 OmpA family protein [Flavobacterium sp. NRK F7]